MHGYIEMILVLSGESKVMRSKSLKSELIEVICLGHNIDFQVHLTLLVLEEGNDFKQINLDFQFLQEIVEIVMVSCIRNMMCYWIKFINNLNQQHLLEVHFQFILHIIISNNSTIKSGMKEIDIFMIVMKINKFRNLSTIFFIRLS